MQDMIRALQPDIMGYAGALIFALVVWVVGSVLLGKQKFLTQDLGPEASLNMRKVSRYCALAIVIVTIFVATLRVVTYSSVNRVERSDTDGSAVYDRMNQNATPAIPTR